MVTGRRRLALAAALLLPSEQTSSNPSDAVQSVRHRLIRPIHPGRHRPEERPSQEQEGEPAPSSRRLAWTLSRTDKASLARPRGGGRTTNHESTRMGSRDAGHCCQTTRVAPFTLSLVHHASPSSAQITTGRPALPASHSKQRRHGITITLASNARLPVHRHPSYPSNPTRIHTPSTKPPPPATLR